MRGGKGGVAHPPYVVNIFANGMQNELQPNGVVAATDDISVDVVVVVQDDCNSIFNDWQTSIPRGVEH